MVPAEASDVISLGLFQKQPAKSLTNRSYAFQFVGGDKTGSRLNPLRAARHYAMLYEVLNAMAYRRVFHN